MPLGKFVMNQEEFLRICEKSMVFVVRIENEMSSSTNFLQVLFFSTRFDGISALEDRKNKNKRVASRNRLLRQIRLWQKHSRKTPKFTVSIR
jgi:hypothetical protein